MSAKFLPKGGRRLGLFASRNSRTNNPAQPWMCGSGSGRRWHSSNSPSAKRVPDVKGPRVGWATYAALGVAVVASWTAYSTYSDAARLKERAYSNPAKLGGQPVYANIKDMTAVSNFRLAIAPYCMY